MALKLLLAMAAAAVGGIYLTSEEGKAARRSLIEKKSAFEPIIKDLLQQATNVFDETKKVNSSVVRANVEQLSNEIKSSLQNFDLDKTVETIKAAIKVASRKLNEAYNEIEFDKMRKNKQETMKIKTTQSITEVKTKTNDN